MNRERVPPFRLVERNPCPCSYAQADSDFRFYKLNSENRLERAYNISCFAPLSAIIRDASGSAVYQQVTLAFALLNPML